MNDMVSIRKTLPWEPADGTETGFAAASSRAGSDFFNDDGLREGKTLVYQQGKTANLK
jgi:hypothetical protein